MLLVQFHFFNFADFMKMQKFSPVLQTQQIGRMTTCTHRDFLKVFSMFFPTFYNFGKNGPKKSTRHSTQKLCFCFVYIYDLNLMVDRKSLNSECCLSLFDGLYVGSKLEILWRRSSKFEFLFIVLKKVFSYSLIAQKR